MTIIIQNAESLTGQVANRAFVPLAIEAGIEVVIASLVPLAKDKLTLLGQMKVALQDTNPALAAALGIETLTAILDYMAVKAATVVPADQLPVLLDQDGPSVVNAGRDGGTPTQINIGFTTPPVGFQAEIYLDGVYQKTSTQPDSGGNTFDILNDVAAGAHTVRVLYKRTSDGAITRFGPLSSFS